MWLLDMGAVAPAEFPSTAKQGGPGWRTHPGLTPRFLGEFYCHFDTIAEGVISRQKGWGILIRGITFHNKT